MRSSATTLAALAALLMTDAAAATAQQADAGEAQAAARAGRAASDDAASVGEAATEDEPLLADEELDELVAPVALYPDALLSQVLIAATYPLEIVKAQRWVEANRERPNGERLEAAVAEGWDPSVTALAAGFPDVVLRMAEDLDWTETLGEALLAQSEDVLDAVQRQRARAAAAGALASNAAQTVTVEDDSIEIVPTDPAVIYVPTYDPAVAYAPPPDGYVAPLPSYTLADPYVPPPGTDVVMSSGPTTVVQKGYSDGALITTGVLAFGAGILVSELFEDDDDCCWGGWGDWDDDDYDGPRVDWDSDDIYRGRGDVNIDGDVNINRGAIDVDKAGRWQADRKRREDAVASLDRKKGDRARRGGAEGPRPRGQAGAEQPARDRDRAAAAASVQDRVGPGATDRPKRARDDGQAAKQLRARDAGGAGGAQQPQRDRAARTGLDRPRDGLAETRAAKKRGEATVARASPSARPKVAAKPKIAKKPSTPQRSKALKTGSRSAFKPDRGGARKASAHKSRGSRSVKRSGGGGRAKRR